MGRLRQTEAAVRFAPLGRGRTAVWAELDDQLPAGWCPACEEAGGLAGHFQCARPPVGYESRRHIDGSRWVAEPQR